MKKDFEKRLSQLRGKKTSQGMTIDSDDRVEKLTTENARLREDIHTSHDQIIDLKKMMVILQEQIISLSEGKQQSQETDRSQQGVILGFQKGLKEIVNLFFESPIELELNNLAQIEECVNFVKGRLLESESVSATKSENQISSLRSKRNPEEINILKPKIEENNEL